MRKAVQLAQDAGLQVIFTLHDQLFIMFKSEDIHSMDILKECMYEAFIFYFEGKAKEAASLIRLDGKVWGNEINDGEIITDKGFKIEAQKHFVDKRSKKQYNQFSKFFKLNLSLDLL